MGSVDLDTLAALAEFAVVVLKALALLAEVFA